MRKDFLNEGQLKILAYRQNNEKKKAILEALICMREHKYMTKKSIQRLAGFGWTEKMIYAKTSDDQLFTTKSKQIDLINNTKLRIGLGKRGLYDYNWIEIDVEK